MLLGFVQIQWQMLQLWEGILMERMGEEVLAIPRLTENVPEYFAFRVHSLIILKISIEQIDIQKTYSCNYAQLNIWQKQAFSTVINLHLSVLLFYSTHLHQSSLLFPHLPPLLLLLYFHMNAPWFNIYNNKS